MTREQLGHILRAASTIAGDPDVLVIGSQSFLGSFADGDLPLEATSSMGADIAFFDEPADVKADQVDGAIGELSAFHETFGYYAQGVSVSTAVLPEGWRNRVIALATPSTAPGRGLCLDLHDCVISKLVAGREKDLSFATALVREGLINLDILADRIGTVGENLPAECLRPEPGQLRQVVSIHDDVMEPDRHVVSMRGLVPAKGRRRIGESARNYLPGG